MDKLYDKIGTTAVMKAAPMLLIAGAGIFYVGQKGIQFFKKRKEMIRKEPELKKDFGNSSDSPSREVKIAFLCNFARPAGAKTHSLRVLCAFT